MASARERNEALTSSVDAAVSAIAVAASNIKFATVMGMQPARVG